MENLWLFIVLALLAEVLGTVGGFGSSLFFVPIAGYFLEFHSVLGVTALFHVSSNIIKIIFFKKGVDKKLLLQLGIPAVLFVVAGAFLSKYINSKILETSLAFFLITLSLVFLLRPKLVIEPTRANAIGGGVLSGFIAGLLGTGGAIRGLVLTAFDLKMEAFIATSAVIDLAIDASRSVVYTLNGYVHRDILYLIPILLAVSIVGTYLGKKILDRLDQKHFKRIVLVLILITGVMTLGKMILQYVQN